MASPTINFAGAAQLSSPGSSLNVSTGPYSAGQVLLLIFGSRNTHGAGVITMAGGSVTGGSHLSAFQQVANMPISYPNAPGQFETSDLGMDAWWAYTTGSSAGDTLTVPFSGAAQDVVIQAGFISGVYSDTDPFDSIPSSVAHANGTTTVTYSTLQADDLLLFSAFAHSSTGSGTPGGWSVLSGPALDPDEVLCSLSVSSPQTSQTAATTGAWGHVAAVFALTADAKIKPLQTFVTCF